MVIQDHYLVMIKEVKMLEINDKEKLISISGGSSISGTLIKSLVSGVNAILEIGRSIGSSIRRLESDNLCEI